MTDVKYNRLVTKIFWFVLPIMIGFFTWIVITLYSVNTKADVSYASDSERYALQEKMWVMLQENNKMLAGKADETTNVAQHNILMSEIKALDSKMIVMEHTNKQLLKSLAYTNYPMYDSAFFTKSEEIKVPNPKEINMISDSLIWTMNENIWANLSSFKSLR